MKKRIWIIVLIYGIFLLTVTGLAGIGDWTTYTNKSDVRDIAYADSTLWCVSNGGVFSIRITDSTYQEFTNTSGLSSIDVQTVEIDHYGNVWIGLSDGMLNMYDHDTGVWEMIDEYEGHTINDIVALGDSLFIALDIGISLYNIQRHEVKETYKNLGPGFPVEIPVNSIYIHGRDVWAGTDNGIAKSSLDIVNLMAPESWTNYSKEQSGLLSNSIKAITGNGNIIYAGSDKGIDRFDGKNWKDFATGIVVTALVTHNGVIYAGTTNGVHAHDGTGWKRLGQSFSNVSSLVVDEQNRLWAGRYKSRNSEGYSTYDAEQDQWIHFIPPGPSGNNFKSLAVDHDGVLWGCTNKNGIVRFDGQKWQHYNIRALGYSDDGMWAVKVDRFNNKWFGSWGAGLIKIDEQDNITVFNEGYLSGIAGNSTYIPVTNVAIDSKDNVWCIIYNAGDGNVLSVVTPDGEWQHFSTNDGIITNTDRELFGLAIDQYDRVWVGSTIGVSVLDPNGTVLDKSDDKLAGTLTKIDGMLSNDVRSMAEDFDGIMWLGTNQGLNFWQGQVYEQVGVIHDNIQTVAVDTRNNKWFGTVAGISVLAPDNYTWTHYTTSNSDLVTSQVTAFAFDQMTGKVYIGTTNGMSVLQTPYAKAEVTLDKIVAGPNPFFPGSGTEFTIFRLADEVNIKFLTPAGMLVRNIPKDEIQGFYAWDGRDDSGQLVSSGVYLYVIYSEQSGQSKVGKVAVIR